MKICGGDDFVRPNNQKRGGEDKGPQIDKHRRKNEERVGRFHTTYQNILMEIKGNPILRCPSPLKLQRNLGARTFIVNTMRTTGTLPLSIVNSRKPSTSWLVRDNPTASLEQKEVGS